MNFTERLDEIEGRANAATEGPTLTRYDHGGGRLAVFHGDHRALVADFYGEGDREFYAAARSDVPALVTALRAVLAMVAEVQASPRRTNHWLSAAAVEVAIASALDPS